MTPRTTAEMGAVLAVLAQAEGGISSVEIARRCGLVEGRAKTLLKMARIDGKAKVTRAKLGALWFTPGRWPAIKAAIAEERRQRNAQRNRSRYPEQAKVAAELKAGNLAALGKLPESFRRVVELAKVGATAQQLAESSGLSRDRVSMLLLLAGRAGLLVKVRHGIGVLWVSPAEADALRAGLPKRLRAERRPPAAAQAKPHRDETGDEDGLFVQRVGVDPSTPLPFRCAAPRSVFDLGAML